jgi:hypothetical protein
VAEHARISAHDEGRAVDHVDHAQSHLEEGGAEGEAGGGAEAEGGGDGWLGGWRVVRDRCSAQFPVHSTAHAHAPQRTPMHRSPRPVQPAHLDLGLGVVTQPHGVAGHHGRLVLLEAADGRLEVRRELIPLELALLVHGEGDVVRVELLVVLRRGTRHGSPPGYPMRCSGITHARAVCMGSPRDAATRATTARTSTCCIFISSSMSRW